jgi:hypothetical protein
MTDVSADSASGRPQLGNTSPGAGTRIRVMNFGLLACACGDELPSVIADAEDPRTCVRPGHNSDELHEAWDGTTW